MIFFKKLLVRRLHGNLFEPILNELSKLLIKSKYLRKIYIYFIFDENAKQILKF
jgi:hypothetical protein